MRSAPTSADLPLRTIKEPAIDEWMMMQKALAEPQVDRLDIDNMVANARQAAEFLKALSHESRLVILCLLVEGERSVAEIEQTLGLRQPAVSQQLARLRADRLVETRRDGKNIHYSLARPEVRDIIVALHAAFCTSQRGR